ncbi:MAG: hypothetical protein AABX14_04570, partial [Candidatus Aenigmatarchaeota archaeon]
MLAALVLIAPAYAASSNNISILYGWNGTTFVPATITNTGALLTTINMSKSLGLSPEANNTYDLGSAAKLWANLYVRSLRGSGPISIIGDANVTGTLYAGGLAGDGSNITNIGSNLSLNYGYNGTNWLPLATTADGTLRLNVRDAQSTNASTLVTGATGSDLTLTGTLTVGGVNVTGRQASDNTTIANTYATLTRVNADNTTQNNWINGVDTRQTADNSTLLALLGQKLNLTGGTLSGSLTGTTGTFANGLNVTAGGLIVAAGNVGIGTTGPGYGLDVYKDGLRINSPASNPVLYFSNNGTLAGLITGSATVLSLETQSTRPIIFQTNGSERVRIDGSGNVGIGTTGPGYKLDVNTASEDGIRTISASQTVLRLDTTNVNSAARNYGISISNTVHGDFNIQQSNALGGNPISAGTSRFYINPSGNVGIGTTGPGARLEVSQ